MDFGCGSASTFFSNDWVALRYDLCRMELNSTSSANNLMGPRVSGAGGNPGKPPPSSIPPGLRAEPRVEPETGGRPGDDPLNEKGSRKDPAAKGSRSGPLAYPFVSLEPFSPPLSFPRLSAEVGSGMDLVSSPVFSTRCHAYNTADATANTTTNVPKFSYTIASVLGIARHAMHPAAKRNANRREGVLNTTLGKPVGTRGRNPAVRIA